MEENELMKKYIIIFMLLILCVGCSSSNKVNFDEYESIKYVEKIIDVVEQYQMGDLTSKEARDKLDVLSESLDAIKEDEANTCLKNMKNDDDPESIDIHVGTIELSISGIKSSTRLVSWYILKNDYTSINEQKKEIKDSLDRLKEHIGECK